MESRLERAIRKGRHDIAADLEAELAIDAFPEEATNVWNAWSRMRRRKPAGFAGPEPLTWLDVDAFLRRSQVYLSSTEVDLLEIIDDAFLASMKTEATPAEEQLALKDGLRQVGKRAR